MNKKIKHISIFSVILLTVLSLSCQKTTKKASDKNIDFQEIKERGELIVGISSNSTDYFVYRGNPMGFQFEILTQFSERHNLKLKLLVENDLETAYNYLNNQEIDIIAQNLTVTPERQKKLSFTNPIAQTRQVIVQRSYPFNKKDSAQHIKNQLELNGKTVYIQKNGAAYSRLQNIETEIAGDINIVENDSLEMEELIQLVADGIIDYAACDENVAYINKSYYPNIDISVPISFSQNLAWAVREESQDLKDSINVWLTEYKETKEYQYIYHKYYRSSRASQTKFSDFYSGGEGKISPYDAIIKNAAESIEWDWRLLASLIYQESQFKVDLKSWAGAFGIMQFMPSTAKFLGIDSNSSTEEQIYAGVKFIQYIDKMVPETVTSKQERIKFILAGYNIGFGHIQDAIKLAEKYGKNPNVWDNNVAYFLLQKSKPKYYQDEVVSSGYCKGRATVKYVDEVIERYEHYCNLFPDC